MGRARVIEREIEVGMGIVQTVVASWLQGKLMHDRIPKPATRCGFDPIRQVLLNSRDEDSIRLDKDTGSRSTVPT
jgi:hypothetical protein